MDLPPGTVIAGRYTLERLLGHGGMGAVYVAHDRKFGERVALKVAAVVGATAEQCKDRFRREARIGYKLGRSSGFVRAFDWGEFGPIYLYLALDLVDGAQPLDLESGTRKQRLTRLRAASRLVAQAHQEGVIHRDLKPENFLQAPDGTISLADFGLAKLVNEREDLGVQDPTDMNITGTNVGMGTPRFMAPEQFEDAKNVDERGDVYSLGVMLFLALTKVYPYQGSKVREYVTQHTKIRLGQLQLPRPRDVDSRVTDQLDALCAAAIAIEPQDRLATVEAFIAGLDQALLTKAKPAKARPKTGRKATARKKRATPLHLDPLPDPLPAGLEPGEQEREVVNTRDGSTLIWIPPGTFRMGSKDELANDDESPVFRVTLSHGYFLAKVPVTWAQYRRFCEVAGWEPPDPTLQVGQEPVAGPDHPVFNISWEEAAGYCTWAGVRLPTEAEWEYGARGADGRRFPWGDPQPTAEQCNWEGHPDHAGSTSPVGSFPAGASPWGCLDMAGNVWEWVRDWYDSYSRWVKTDPLGPEAGGMFKVQRGGSWSTPPIHCRTTTRRMLPPHMRSTNLGFRICR